MHFKLEVKGVGDSLVARLYSADKLVEEWYPKDIKNAHKDADGIATQYKMENSPSDVISHEKSFIL